VSASALQREVDQKGIAIMTDRGVGGLHSASLGDVMAPAQACGAQLDTVDWPIWRSRVERDHIVEVPPSVRFMGQKRRQPVGGITIGLRCASPPSASSAGALKLFVETATPGARTLAPTIIAV
jgi:hypothetical protein